MKILLNKQEDSNKANRIDLEVEKMHRRQNDINSFKEMNDYNLKMKRQRQINGLLNKKKIDNYIVMKDYMDNLNHSHVEASKRSKQQLELRQVLDQQVRDNVNRKSKDRFLTEKEFYLNKPILDKMSCVQSPNQNDQERLIS